MNAVYLNLRYGNIRLRKKSVVDAWNSSRKCLEYEDHYDIITESPPSYESAIGETELKRWKALETINTHSAERAWSTSSLSSLSSDTEEEQDVPSLLTEIKLLKKQQEDMKKRQRDHEQHLKELLERQPLHHRRLSSFSYHQTDTKVMSKQSRIEHQLRRSSSYTKDVLTGLNEELFIQLKQMYVNTSPFNGDNPGMPNLKHNAMSHDILQNEIISLKEQTRQLKEKVSELESERTEYTSKYCALYDETNECRSQVMIPSCPPAHSWGGSSASTKICRSDGNKDESGRAYCSNPPGCHFVVGKPTLTPPMRAILPDIKPIEMTFKWTISDYFSKLRSEHLGYMPKQTSSPFYLAHCGYRCQMEAYLNGDGTARDKGLSVFLRVIKGDYDKLLTWPVYLSLDIVLINQSETCGASLKAGENQFQFREPSGTSDSDTDSWGLVEFIQHDVIKTRNYIRNDEIIFKCRVRLLQ
ncbi:uncharacterized protein LOC106078230 isoform X1 [Biomphalaria glabrata]|uniref:Uncharacterized protein LOC106078230 isoform X1 n=1 Tax=Biomphalaria glabrata TaxID=6526 RepID=A0A9W3B506_BIOGL|nr:uncharacterized protein LOC106078230 isoform X1 [Biomphalaria glabrata]